MLEKNAKKLYFDAHFHYENCISSKSYIENDEILACSCAHSIEEWQMQCKNSKLIQSYGIHPQMINNNPLQKELDFLEDLLINKKLNAIGETGFDYYSDDYKQYSLLQDKYFNTQIELALEYNLPVIIHCRKANNKLFEYESKLKQLPAVLFHSFMGPSTEAFSLIKKGINSYFSFGKQIMNNNKKVLDCALNLPLENLLLETDAPFQTLKNEENTKNIEIIGIYESFCLLRKEEKEIIYNQFKKNFYNCFKLN